MMKRKELFEGLTKEQIEKAKNCKTNEELLELAKEEGVELTDEQLEAVSGGACNTTTVNLGPCPNCGSSNFIYGETGDFSITKYDCECMDCQHRWIVKEYK